MSTRASCSLLLVVFVALGFGLGGCGGGDGGTRPTPVTQPPAPARVSVVQSSTEISAPPDDQSYFFAVMPFSTTETGTIEVRVDWTYATNIVFVLVTGGACSAVQYQNADCPDGPTCECTFVATSFTSGPKPRVLTVPSAAPGPRAVIVENLGPREESVNVQVTLIR